MATKEKDGTIFQSQRKVALVIGIGTYDHIEGLENPGNDENDMSDALQSIGFIVTKKVNIERRERRHVIIDFEASIKPEDMVLFYFVGHGAQWEVCIKVKVILICYSSFVRDICRAKII